jgi:hypothetical protein
MAPGVSLLDDFERSYTVLRLGAKIEPMDRLVTALKTLGAPVCERIVDDPRLRALYGRDIFLIRPDLHIAWRGNAAPDNPERLAAFVTGRRHT